MTGVSAALRGNLGPSLLDKRSENEIMTSIGAIVLAGGMGTRFGSDRPKQLLTLAGRPILSYALQLMDECAQVGSITVPSNMQWAEQIRSIVNESVHNTPVYIVEGGRSRNESVWNAITSLTSLPERLIVHDGVRPLATATLLESVIQSLEMYDAVLPAIQSSDLLAVVEGNIVRSIEDRNIVLRGQSPQGFRTSTLVAGLKGASMAQLAAYPTLFEPIMQNCPDSRIGVIDGEPHNIKVTQAIDMAMATAILAGADS